MAKHDDLNTFSVSNSPKVAENTKWRFGQVKRSYNDQNITCVDFNHDGQLIAVGTSCGHIITYKRIALSKTLPCSSKFYKLYTHFKSHHSEFDFLKSLEIEEKINKICWLHQKHNPYYLLSTNDKLIKLWKINEYEKCYESFNTFDDDDDSLMRENENIASLGLPRIQKCDLMVKAKPSKIFSNLHKYDINSLSLNSDQETFLSADDLRINVWHLDVTNSSFNVVDIEPKCLADLTDVITSAEFHPKHCNIFAYSSSGGAIRLCDMRSSALCDQNSKLIKDIDSFSNTNELNPLSYIRISPSGRYLLARDFMNLNIYDLQMENKLLEKYPVHDFLRGKAMALYKTQRIFDRFECCWSGNEDYVMTGTYNNFFKIFDRKSNSEVMLEAQRDQMKPRALLKTWHVSTKRKLKPNEINVDNINYNNKIQFTAWHPKEKTIAVAAKNDLLIYREN